MLGLTTGAPMMHHQLFCHGTRNFRTQILFDHCQRKIETSRGTCRSPNWTIDDENSVLLNLCLGKTPLQFSSVIPMRSRAATLQQSSFAHGERARANGCHAP